LTRKAKAVPAAETPKETENLQSEIIETPNIPAEPKPQTPQEEMLFAIRTMLDEHDKTLPATIRNEVQKMLQEARAEQQKQQPTAQAPAITSQPQFEAPPTNTGGMMGGLAQALPTIMQMIGGNSGQDEITKQFMAKVMESGLNNLTLGSQFLTAITQMVMKNVGTNISTSVASSIAPVAVTA
jgi:hypothetical protein